MEGLCSIARVVPKMYYLLSFIFNICKTFCDWKLDFPNYYLNRKIAGIYLVVDFKKVLFVSLHGTLGTSLNPQLTLNNALRRLIKEMRLLWTMLRYWHNATWMYPNQNLCIVVPDAILLRRRPKHEIQPYCHTISKIRYNATSLKLL